MPSAPGETRWIEAPLKGRVSAAASAPNASRKKRPLGWPGTQTRKELEVMSIPYKEAPCLPFCPQECESTHPLNCYSGISCEHYSDTAKNWLAISCMINQPFHIRVNATCFLPPTTMTAIRRPVPPIPAPAPVPAPARTVPKLYPNNAAGRRQALLDANRRAALR